MVELRQCGFGRLEVGDQHAVLIARPQLDRPRAVRLVFQDVATSETERPLECGAGGAGRRTQGLNEQCVEAVEVDHDQLRGESVRLSLCHDELSTAAGGGCEVAAEHRHEGMERPGDVVRRISAPEKVRHAIEGDRVAARREQDLEQLLRPGSAEVAGAEHVVSALHRQRPEQANHRAFGGHGTARANARMYG